jgi:hypothetical protein
MMWKSQGMRELMKKFRSDPLPTWEMKNTTKRAYGKVNFTQGVSLFDTLKTVQQRAVRDVEPQTFDSLDTAFGFVLYETKRVVDNCPCCRSTIELILWWIRNG